MNGEVKVDFPLFNILVAFVIPGILMAPKRILVADDQTDVLGALRLLLKGEGWEVTTTTSPAGVLRALAKSEGYSDSWPPVTRGNCSEYDNPTPFRRPATRSPLGSWTGCRVDRPGSRARAYTVRGGGDLRGWAARQSLPTPSQRDCSALPRMRVVDRRSL